MVKIQIDISLFTKDAAFGRVSGPLTVAIVPQIGDHMTFRVPDRVEAYCGLLPFGGLVRVTDRIISADPDGSVVIALEDLTAATSDDARLSRFQLR